MHSRKHFIILILSLFDLACFTKTENSFAVMSGGVEDICDIAPLSSNCQDQEPESEFSQEDPDNPYGEEDTEVDALEDTSCDEEMRVRKIIPLSDKSAPLNTKPIVLTIGNGDETHLTVELINFDQNQPVEIDQDIVCYLHESHTEIHCTYLLEPLQELSPNTKYMVQVKGTEFHQDPDSEYRSWFTTTSERATMSNQAPYMEILGYMDREPSGVEFCDWKDARKYELQTIVADEQPDNLSIVQVYEVHDLNSGAEDLVHSIIVPMDYPSIWYRQVLTPGTEGPRCYRSYHRDVAGNESPSSEILCWEEGDEDY